MKQRFSIWYNRNHGDRRGTLSMDRFKSVLVEGKGNPSQTMSVDSALQLHREMIFGKRAAEPGLSEMSRQRALQVLEVSEGLR